MAGISSDPGFLVEKVSLFLVNLFVVPAQKLKRCYLFVFHGFLISDPKVDFHQLFIQVY
jgi:hypothetical protein